MKRESSISIGPGASSLILIFVMLSMCVLGMLSLMSSRNDLQLSERSSQVAEEIYTLNEKANMTLARMAKDPYSHMDSQKKIAWTEESENYTLSCEVEVVEKDGGIIQYRWVKHMLEAAIAGSEDEWNF